MGEVVEALLARVRKAQADLSAARMADDAYAVAVAEDELDDAVRLARGNGVDVEVSEASGEE
ncbi:MAG TPA: hypothetical protein DD420_25675 [Streptomyces sp.]|nr:hypothetical protein [Streptomyces sp.]